MRLYFLLIFSFALAFTQADATSKKGFESEISAENPPSNPYENLNFSSSGEERDLWHSVSGSNWQNGWKELCNFYLSHGFVEELASLMDYIKGKMPLLYSEKYFQALSVVAYSAKGKWKEIESALVGDGMEGREDLSPWRAVSAYRNGYDQDHVSNLFLKAEQALAKLPAKWAFPVQMEQAKFYLETKDIKSMSRVLWSIEEPEERSLQEDLVYMRAVYYEAAGHYDEADSRYELLRNTALGQAQVKAYTDMVRRRLEQGKIQLKAAISKYEELLLGWRFLEGEKHFHFQLANMYLKNGSYRKAWSLLSTDRFKEDFSSFIGDSFINFFLTNQRQSVGINQLFALYQDFVDFVEDEALRDRARLVMIKSLEESRMLPLVIQLLEYQVTFRQSDQERSVYGLDLAKAYLENGNENEALRALDFTYWAGTSGGVLEERRYLRSQIMTALGKYGEALFMLGLDKGDKLDQLRMEIYWKQKNWAKLEQLSQGKLQDNAQRTAWRIFALLGLDRNQEAESLYSANSGLLERSQFDPSLKSLIKLASSMSIVY